MHSLPFSFNLYSTWHEGLDKSGLKCFDNDSEFGNFNCEIDGSLYSVYHSFPKNVKPGTL